MGSAASVGHTLIAEQLKQVEVCFSEELRSSLPHVNNLVEHVSKFRGKMLRPMLVLLSGLAANEKVILNATHITLATVVEMVHMSTLVHDDVLDGAEVRRRGATIHHLHGNEAAVLLGDYLISHAFHLCSSLNTQEYSRLVSHATNIVCEGELTQNFNRNNWDLSEEVYYDIIYRKTAALTEVCCRLGAMVSAPNQASVDALAAYGKFAGMAFQIIDDVLDLVGEQKTVGKTLGSDIEKGKLTLPMLHFIRNAAPQHRDLLIDLLGSQEVDRVERVRQLVAPSSSVVFARKEAEKFVDRAITSLQILPATEARDVLTDMAHFITARQV